MNDDLDPRAVALADIVSAVATPWKERAEKAERERDAWHRQSDDLLAENARNSALARERGEIIAQDEARLRAAAEKVGVPPAGCETPDHIAEAVLTAKAEAAWARRERDAAKATMRRAAEFAYLSPQPACDAPNPCDDYEWGSVEAGLFHCIRSKQAFVRCEMELSAERKATIAQDEARLRAAAEKAGVTWAGCETADHIAEALLTAKAEAARAHRERDAVKAAAETMRAAMTTPEGYRGVVADAVADELERAKGEARRLRTALDSDATASENSRLRFVIEAHEKVKQRNGARLRGIESALYGDLIAARVPHPSRSRAETCRDWAAHLRKGHVRPQDRDCIAVLLDRMAAALSADAAPAAETPNHREET